MNKNSIKVDINSIPGASVGNAKRMLPLKTDPELVDILSAKDIENIRKALRRVWSWSKARKICLARAVGKDGFPRCELCKTKVPKVYPDHIEPVGDVDSGFIARLWCSSTRLQAICKKCHNRKTKDERAFARALTPRKPIVRRKK